jgi:predicted NBD/HSP70 family sugar kinase
MDAFDFGRRPSGKILFAEDFDLPTQDDPPEPEVIEPTFTAAELEAACAEARQAGRDAAATEAAAAAAAADHAVLRETVTAIAAQLAVAHAELLDLAEQSANTIGRLLLGSLGAVLPQLVARYGEAELQAIVRIVLPGLFREPAVTLRLNPQHCSSMAREIERLDPDLAARLQIVPTDSIPAGAGGRARRHRGGPRHVAALWEQVVATLDLSGLSPAPVEAPVEDLVEASVEAAVEAKEIEHAR